MDILPEKLKGKYLLQIKRIKVYLPPADKFRIDEVNKLRAKMKTEGRVNSKRLKI